MNKPKWGFDFIAGLIWRYRYMQRIRKCTGCGLKHGWYLASVHYEENEWWLDEPEDAAYEEFSCWND